MISEHDIIVLKENLPAERLQAGDVGTVIHIHADGAGYEVEFIAMNGHTVAVATVLASQLRSVSGRDLSHVRELAAS